MGNYFKAFNLIIDSCIELPEAAPVEGVAQADVTVRYGKVDMLQYLSVDSIPPDTYLFLKLSDSHMIFNSLAGIYEIRDGKEITIELAPGADERMVRIFLMGSSLGAIQYQRGYLPLHGGAIVCGGKAVIISGTAGAGKSTMTSTLVEIGFPYLTDDVSCVEYKDNVPYIIPSYPQRKLVRDACVTLGYDPSTLPVADEKRDKFAIRDGDRWQDTAAPLDMIVELVPAKEGEPLKVEQLTAIERIRVITDCIYRPQYHKTGGGIPPCEMKKFFAVASAVKMYTIHVPRDIENIKQLAGDMAQKLGLVIEK